ncbi:delta endotoxin C-terminal domain-containing protein [Bacillus mycoides]|uniref:delta endotoxin C-terminal domain-containing protein n=1 Tax=Bacillus mycoides TaxID=1405 RepID=UPI003CFD15D0
MLSEDFKLVDTSYIYSGGPSISSNILWLDNFSNGPVIIDKIEFIPLGMTLNQAQEYDTYDQNANGMYY